MKTTYRWPMRNVYEADAIKWLNENKIESASLVASMPDYSEFPELSLDEWKNWFTSTAELIINSTAENGVAIFYQSDIKHDGRWIDKAYLCQKAAEKCGSNLLWHKIINRVPVNVTTFGRPSYSHIICFSKNLKLDTAKSTPDVIAHVGEKIWERGMGVEACMMIAKFLSEQVNPEVVINPFCGMGSLVSVLEAYQLNSIGIERSRKRADKAREIKFNLELKSWI